MLWVPRTAKDCWTWVAASWLALPYLAKPYPAKPYAALPYPAKPYPALPYPALPAWLASMTQVPTATSVTVAPEMLQLPCADESIEKVTGLPLAPPLAVGV